MCFSQDSQKKHRCSVVAMFLEYVMQTLEDDFHVKSSASAPQQSIAKETLSCNRHFSHVRLVCKAAADISSSDTDVYILKLKITTCVFVRDVLKWLFTAISKSTEQEERPAADREMDEQMRFTLFFFYKTRTVSKLYLKVSSGKTAYIPVGATNLKK